MAFRIAVGGIEHETSSFVPDPTTLADFERRTLTGDWLARLGDANTIVDGFVRGLRDDGLDPVPLIWTKGTSGGVPTSETYRRLKANLLAPLCEALPVDALLLSLHGSFAAEGIDDADGDILAAVRELVGPRCPVIAVHDLHCNITRGMAESADALIVERTYPHTDMAERGVDAARLAARILTQGIRPAMGYRSLPLLWSAPQMITSQSPMSEAIGRLNELGHKHDVLSAGIGVGYQWIDSPVVGASTVVVTDSSADRAQQYADELARWIWERRESWQREPLSPAAALKRREQEGRFPIILADQADNTGGGAPGDSTEVLRLFVERDLDDAAVLYMVDPHVAEAAHRAGVRATIEVEVGGKSHRLLGPPVCMQAEVMALSDGRFTYDGPMWAGVEGFHGPSALLRQRGVYVAVISERQQPIDLAFSRSLGLDCRNLRYISVKSTGHFRSGFEPIAGSIDNVDAAGLFTQDFKKLPYSRLGRKMYPLDQDVAVDW